MTKQLVFCCIMFGCSFSQTISIDTCLAQLEDRETTDSMNGTAFYTHYLHFPSQSRLKILELKSSTHQRGDPYIFDSLNVYVFDYCQRSKKRHIAKFVPRDNLSATNFYFGLNWTYWSIDETTIYLGVQGTTLSSRPNEYVFLSIKLGDTSAVISPILPVNSLDYAPARSPGLFSVDGRVNGVLRASSRIVRRLRNSSELIVKQ